MRNAEAARFDETLKRDGNLYTGGLWDVRLGCETRFQ